MGDWLKAKLLRDSEDENREKCKCSDCGKEFYHGEEGDNETICLRCEHLFMISFSDEY